MDHFPQSLTPTPPRVPYKLSNLLSLPRRLLRSPLASSSSSAPLGLLHGNSQRIKLEHLRLADLYEGTLPPVSLKDLENYLIFQECSVENLYFDGWLRSYSALFHSIAHAHPSHADSLRATLTASYNLGLSSFLHEDSLLELNITGETRRNLDTAIGTLMFTPTADGTNGTFLPPDAFDALHAEIKELLENSFRAFMKHQRGNGGRKRGYFAVAVGVMSYLVGWVPLLVAVMLTEQRGWRVFGLPFFFLGVLVLYGGLKNTCLVIYLIGGDSRQLFPWEISFHQPSRLPLGPSATLPPPAISKQRISPSDSKSSSRPSTADTVSSGSKSIFTLSSPEPVHLSHSDRSPPPPATHTLTLKTSPQRPALSRAISSASAQRVPLLYPLQHFPPLGLMLGPNEPPCFEPYEMRRAPPCESCVFGSLTPVLAPEVKEYQRGVVLRGMVWGLGAMLVSGAVALGVPSGV